VEKHRTEEFCDTVTPFRLSLAAQLARVDNKKQRIELFGRGGLMLKTDF